MSATLGTWLLLAAVAYLLLVYAIAPPIVLARSIADAARRHRRRYRPVHDEVMATSRFTIPVSIVLPVGLAGDAVQAVQRLLALDYPELEVIVVNHVSAAPLAALRERFALSACEVFYRRSLRTAPVRGLYRSSSEPRLLVVDVRTDGRGEALNCGANLARFRYVCCPDERAAYDADALLRSMHAAVEDPAEVVGITTSLAPPHDDEVIGGRARGAVVYFHRLALLRSVLARSWRRGLGLAPDGVPGFTLWRRDVLLELGGFSNDVALEHVEFTLRVQRVRMADRRRHRIIHLAEPVGTAGGEFTLAGLVDQRRERQRANAVALWRHLGMVGNPRFGRFGLLDLPRYAFNTFVVPWLELVCLAALPVAAITGALTIAQLGLIVAALAFGNGILLNSALLLSPPPARRSMGGLLALAPIELFLARPVQLYARVLGLLPVSTRA